MNNKAIILFSIAFINAFFSVKAQIPDPVYETPEATVHAIGKSFGDSVLIRWAPGYVDAWISGNKLGYDLYRYKIKENDSTSIEKPVRLKLNNSPILPLPVNEIERLYATDNYAAIIAQAIYGESFDLISSGDKGNLINQAKELDNRYSFSLFACDMSVNASKSHGLLYIDTDIEFQASYVYVIRPAWKDTLALMDSAFLFIAVNDTFAPPKPVGIASRFGDKFVELSWNFELLESVFTSYHVERSDDNGKTFKRINKSPIINTTQDKNKSLKRIFYVDTIPDNTKYYSYRVRGITPFGEISQPSDVVHGIGIPQELGLNPINMSSPMQDSTVIRVKWEFEALNENKIKGFVIERAEKADGPYAQLSDTLSPNLREYTDKLPLTVNYYQICAISKIIGSYCSFPALIQMPDSIPPSVPAGLKGVIDSTGIVTLSWNRNTEPDMMSYSIFLANNPEGEFVQINTQMVTDTFFVDTVTLSTLTKNVYYAITASDRHYNPSARTKEILIIRPDTIPPAPPVFKNYSVRAESILLYWHSSPSNDVLKQVLYRKGHNVKEWTTLAVFDSTQITEYEDKDISSGVVFDYLILAVDQNMQESENNQTLSVKAAVKTIENNVVLKLSSVQDEKAIKIEWKSKTENIESIIIYKSIDGGSFQLLSQTEWNKATFIDQFVKIGHTYTYRSQIIDKNGMRSEIGQSVSFNY